MQEIFVLNIGGTFNKRYNECTGVLEVIQDNSLLQTLINKAYKQNLNITLEGVLFKDSLDMTHEDRKIILDKIQSYERVLIVHGTDTMDKTAQYLAQASQNQSIVLTGAMQPYLIDPVEATANFALCVQFLQQSQEQGVYIGMHGLLLPYEKMKKNRTKGVFECQK